jgi:glycosyltransferase involved in cell wall biosynthesis
VSDWRSYGPRDAGLRVVTPVFNDWACFIRLVQELDQACSSLACRVSVLAVDDGSTEPPPRNLQAAGPLASLQKVEIVHLAMNIGHQRAIAVGLALAAQEEETDAIVIMDADGEDRPQDIPRLIEAAQGRDDFIVVAQRHQRTESRLFKILYGLYNFLFTFLTGKKLGFGNFSLLSREYAQRLAMLPDLWNTFPAALMRSRLPITRLPIDRGHRYAGSSKMSYATLIVHGLSGLSVYSDTIFVRMLIGVGGLLAASVLVIVGAITMRLFTDLATPGWATTVVFGTIIIVLQAIVSTLTGLLLLLNNRNQRQVVPALDVHRFVRRHTELPLLRPMSAAS